MKEQSQNNSSSQFLKTDGGKTRSNAIEVPSISLPKGGGAIKGIDEKFQVNAVNGTASFSIPLPFSPARGASPSLTLSYNSGAGNGIFGLGWNLSLGSIKRKTDKGLPQYLDAVDSDIFLFSEAEDLVPEFKRNSDRSFQLDTDGDYIINERDSSDGLFTIRNYRPRIEGLFARIERWTEKANGRINWRVITKDNITTLFGWTDNSIISNPDNDTNIFEWLPEFVFDDKGNCSHYIYKREDDSGIDKSLLHNRNRLKGGNITYTNLYIDKVLYGNITPYKRFGDAFLIETDYMFQTVFDYGSLLANDSFETINSWDFRPDAFSDYKAGFEIRTTRLCKRVLLFHVFEELALSSDNSDKKTLIKSVNFDYDTSTEQDFTFLKTITSFGYIKKLDGTYLHKKLPPMEFEYQKHDWNNEVKTISSEALVHAPSGLDEQQHQFIDLFNEGLSGILTEQANGWYYKHNLGNGKFEEARLVSSKPNFVGLGGQFQLADLDADGGKQLVSLGTEPRGYFELDDDDNWHGLHSFKTLPNINLGDANTRMLDLNGDGKPDVLISDDQVFTWYTSKGRDGFAAGKKTSKFFDEEEGPHIVFADEKQTIYLADMSGDGLTDIVRIRNGEVCYWSNLGYGNFGPKVAMDNAPLFDYQDAFNPSYLRLADIDGSGTSDIIYLGKNKITCWKNLSGNRFSTIPFEIDPFPEIHSQAKITVTDLLGNGVSCIVWSSPLSKDVNAPLKYIDLMNNRKPHLMVSYKNNLGKEVSLEYTASTKFYLEDKLAGKPWATKLHFPVHLLTKTTVSDKWRNTRFTSQIKYHHGYYDHAEREFRGFGRVEQIDAEDFGIFAAAHANSPYITDDFSLYQPPIKTITWYHTGAFLDRQKILNQFQDEYFAPESLDFHENALPETDLNIESLSSIEWQQALRSCKGMILRQEVYELEVDAFSRGEEKRIKLFSTAYHNCKINLVQPKAFNEFAVFFATESEAITYQYELDLTSDVLIPDPRIAHSFNLKYDEYGNLLQSLAATYPRIGQHTETGIADETLALIQEVQRTSLLIFSENHFSNDIITDHNYRLRVPIQAKIFEITGIIPNNGFYFSIEEFRNYNISEVVEEIPYHLLPNRTSPQKRCVEHSRILYFADDLVNPLPWGEQSALGFSYETYKLALTADLLSAVFKQGQLTTEIKDELNDSSVSGYLSGALLQERFPDMNTSGQYWIRSGIAGFNEDAPLHFYLPERYTDSFNNITQLTYDSRNLFIESSTDPIGNITRIEHFNYRVLAPERMIDRNDNISEVVFDILGMPTATALLGKGDEGDSLIGFDYTLLHPTPETIISYFTEAYNETLSRNLLGNASSRSLYYFGEQIEPDGSISYGHHPACAAGIVREKHVSQEMGTPGLLQAAFVYSDASGNVIVTKKQAEPEREGLHLRWLANGKTILNNKGKPVKQYEPYFSSVGHQYEEPREEGVTPIIYYDAAGRQIRTEMPDGTFTKVTFTPWFSATWDANDTILEPNNAWFIRNSTGSPAQQKAARLSAIHANTPAIVHFDGLGRETIFIAHNKLDRGGSIVEEKLVTYSKLDTEGKLLWIEDARGNRVMEYINRPGAIEGYSPCYDIAGNLLFQHSMDAGDRWVIMDSMGQPFYGWDENEHQEGTSSVYEYRVIHSSYDALRRPLEMRLKINERDWQVIERVTYGEVLPDANERNLKGQIYQHFDSGGLTSNIHFDFKGNLLEATRQLTASYSNSIIDWSHEIPSSERFVQRTQYDAIGRMVYMENWHLEDRTPSTYTPSYNQRGVLKSEINTVNGVPTEAVLHIEYNAKGQRIRIQYGNGTTTRYHYDPLTFRLVQLRTTRTSPGDILPNAAGNLSDPNVLQNLYYTYDPSGNITEILDGAYEPIFFNNQRVEPRSQYTYDALYRLIKAEGRENSSLDRAPNHGKTTDASSVSFPVNDPLASRNYIQEYHYDAVGNILQMRHRAGVGSFAERWTRTYSYATDSNRLLNTQTGSGESTSIHYAYDTHGSMLNLGNVADEYSMQWDFRDMIYTANLGGGGQVFYNYNTKKERCRKRIERLDGIIEERIYLGGMELYRRWNGNILQEEIETHHLFVDDQRVLITEHILQTNNYQLSTGIVYRYQYSNHLGSVGLECDGSGSIITYEEYHPFGTTAFQAKNAGIYTTAKRYKYTGMERDEETGMAYHTARYYLPWLGRWVSSDPIGIGDGVNIYAYGHCNPISNLDIKGKQATSWRNRLSWGQRVALWIDETVGTENIQAVADFSAGMGDTLSLGGTRDARRQMGTDAVVDTNGRAYTGGQVTGLVVAAPLIVESAAIAAPRIAAAATTLAETTVVPLIQAATTGTITIQTVAALETTFEIGVGLLTEPGQVPDISPSPAQEIAQEIRATARATSSEIRVARESARTERRVAREATRTTRVADDIAEGIAGAAPLSDTELISRARQIQRQLAIAELESRGVAVTEEAIGRTSGLGTVSVVETQVNGQTIRIVTTNRPQFQSLLDNSGSSFLQSGEQLGSRITRVYGPVGRQQQLVHAEQLGVNDAIALGGTEGRVATSNLGCEMCTSLINEFFPGFRHVNPRQAQ
ncbi:MAG: VCBS repeat-containing protein [Sporocytophaga sp.]|uniref:SpvB/TcaC N-terminal domain-containing protein n=1 Tax=Sporocytophaga sp. TaxID=2231183 RepID=UPI001B21101B|nr:SpvB/TcaC N-terminal domain-containing protein [Sporocytophaga sp.]MBO9700910.1 VCBS repeat-containing protein [Sporocytophaga sp.]